MRRRNDDDDKDPTTRREFRAWLGSRGSRRMDSKRKRAGSGKMTKPSKLRYARLVKIWAATQPGRV